MKSKTSFFNSTLFFGLYKRFWPIFAAYLGIWLLILPVSMQNTLRFASEQMQYENSSVGMTMRAASQLLHLSQMGGIVMSAIFAILIAMAAFSYLYSSRSVSMVCALPIKRESIFMTYAMSGLLGMLVSNVIVFALTAAVEAVYGVLIMTDLLQGLAAVCMMNVFFLGFAALCASFTGHVLVLPAVYVVLNFTAAAVELFVRLVLRVLLYGFNENIVCDFAFLSPVVGLISGTSVMSTQETLADGSINVTGYFISGWPMIIGYAVVGVIFLFCAMLLIKHRHMETAGDVVAIKVLKPIFKYCMCVGCALVLGTAVYYAIFVGGWLFGTGTGNIYGIKSMVYMLLFMLLGSFVGYFAADMLMKKTLRVFQTKNWYGYIITAVIIAALVVCAELDVFGYENNIPQTQSIEQVTVQCEGRPVSFEETENLELARALHSGILAHKTENETTEEIGNYNEFFYVDISYTTKNGGYISRNYKLYPGVDDKEIQQLTDLMNSDEGIRIRKEMSIPVTAENFSYANVNYFDSETLQYENIELDAQQMVDFYNSCIAPDIDDKALGKIWYLTDESYYSYVYDATINFELRERRENEVNGSFEYVYDYFDTTVTVDAKRTIAWLEENLGAQLATRKESDIAQYGNMSAEEREKYGYDMEKYGYVDTVDAEAMLMPTTEAG